MSDPKSDTTMPLPGSWARVQWVWADLWPPLRLTLAIIGLIHVISKAVQ